VELIVRTVSLLVLAVASLPLVAHAGDADVDRLGRGEILITSRPAPGAAEVIVRAVFDAPPRRVWDVVSQCGRYTQTMTRIKAARELSRKGPLVICKVTVDMPFPYPDLTAVTRGTHVEAGHRFSRRWDLIEGDYKMNRGSWELEPFRGDARRTLATYRIQALPRPWIPDWLRERGQRRSLPEMIRKIRSQVR
jgi:ribosome-associated toxin RatA of RatAB toxin-antitoxin module